MSSKIHKIKISNFKSIVDFEADFQGCTAIVTGANNSGKSSLLRGITDRIRFVRPDVMVRNGEKEGMGEMILTTGEKFVWEFNAIGKDKLTLITTEGLKHSVTTEIGKKFFPSLFDIDKFLQSAPKSQVKQLQTIVGLDFTEIDARYDKAYITEMPDQTELDKIDAQIVKVSEINASAQKYKEYIDLKTSTEEAKHIAHRANEAVVAIEAERKQMIESVNMPEGITFGTDGILVDGLPLDKNQISTSKLYCAALRIASMNLGEVKTLYFDASFLDRNTLSEIEAWANGHDLQLLIERPDFEAGELRYEIIETVNHE